MLSKLHHVGYRCRDAAETVDFYVQAIGLKFAAALIDHVPSTGLRATNNNVFFEMEDGSYICFFEVLEANNRWCRCRATGRSTWRLRCAIRPGPKKSLHACKRAVSRSKAR